MKNYKGPRRTDDASQIFRTVGSARNSRTNNPAYDSGYAYGTEWARDNQVDVATVRELESSKIESPSSALINEMAGRTRTPRSVLINLGIVLGIRTKDIRDRTRKFYIALKNYDAGFIQGAVNIVGADNH